MLFKEVMQELDSKYWIRAYHGAVQKYASIEWMVSCQEQTYLRVRYGEDYEQEVLSLIYFQSQVFYTSVDPSENHCYVMNLYDRQTDPLVWFQLRAWAYCRDVEEQGVKLDKVQRDILMAFNKEDVCF